MKEEHIKELFEKYKSGETSLNDERFLLDNSLDLDAPLLEWINHERQNKNEVPEDFNDRLWQSLDEKIKPKNRFVKRFFIAAASVILLFTAYNINQEKDKQTLWEKQALLIEAKSMFSEIEQNEAREIVFTDDLITIYTTTINNP